MRLADSLGLVGAAPGQLRMVDAPIADDELIATVHSARLIEAVTGWGSRPGRWSHALGLGTEDDPVFGACTRRPRTSSAPARGAGRSGPGRPCTASTSSVGCTTRWPTGPAASASTTTAVGIQWLLDQGAERRSRTSTSTPITATASGGSGTRHECSPSASTSRPRPCSRARLTRGPGGPDAPGSGGQRAAPAGHRRCRLVARVSTPSFRRLLRAFGPTVLVSQHGCDSHFDDPLTNLMVSRSTGSAPPTSPCMTWRTSCAMASAGWRPVAAATRCSTVVPRTWTHLLQRSSVVARWTRGPPRCRRTGCVT